MRPFEMLSLSCAEADEAVIEKAILAAQAADVDDEDAHPLRVLESRQNAG